ncbi:unnamed protein product (macronuclear) [Paramecium tetraurelia]|uniref:protein-serine/threonine phosphatase n=1 Tax=Paramecium tetraurelia TaxID=5888 RepID=A0BY04_PARTE|nr:uncharacterized protein GSPATT00033274001 [Paramecium tetraurelia]CAK63421.1 unnamed protein product [Paramecium tetraurelia]|eukprot:XP_001430819.1 hypothetical protein (macronuclear) [Paramecium tetraurelia strain d4-2]
MGPYLTTPNTQKETYQGENEKFIFAATHMQGWRNNMEDAHISQLDIEPGVSLFAVFDGHGGKEVAIYAEKHFQEELLKNPNYKQKNYKQALIETFLKIDELLFQPQGQEELIKIKGSGDELQAGATANVALIVNKTIYLANAGDSRAMLCRDNNPLDLSKDHKPDDEKEKQRIETAGGFVQNGRTNGSLSLSRAIGDLEYKKDQKFRQDEQVIIAVPEVRVEEIQANDKFLLMGCDGVFEIWSHKQIIDYVNSQMRQVVTKEDIRIAAEGLLDSVIAKDTSNGTGCDNMTCIIVYFKQ